MKRTKVVVLAIVALAIVGVWLGAAAAYRSRRRLEIVQRPKQPVVESIFAEQGVEQDHSTYRITAKFGTTASPSFQDLVLVEAASERHDDTTMRAEVQKGMYFMLEKGTTYTLLDGQVADPHLDCVPGVPRQCRGIPQQIFVLSGKHVGETCFIYSYAFAVEKVN